MKKSFSSMISIMYLIFLVMIIISCSENESYSIETDDSCIYSIPQESLQDWDEGYIFYNSEHDKPSYYIISRYNDEEGIRTSYYGQTDGHTNVGYYVYSDNQNNVVAIQNDDLTYYYNVFSDDNIWNVYNQEGKIIYTFHYNEVSLSESYTRSSGDKIYGLKGLFENIGLAWHQEWAELTLNIGKDLLLKVLKIDGWKVAALDLIGSVIRNQEMSRLYDWCVPEITNCEKNGKINVTINGVEHLTDKYVTQVYNEYTKQFEKKEIPGKEVYMAVAIKKGDDYVTYSKCDNHTTYVKLSPSQSLVEVMSNINFEPGISYYLRPYLIEKSLFNSQSNTMRQWLIQYGNTYKFRYTTVSIVSYEQITCQNYSETQYAVRANITANIESLNDVDYWGVSIYDKNNELLKELQCQSINGLKYKEFLFDSYLEKSLFENNKTSLIVIPYAKYNNGQYAYGEKISYDIIKGICPDENHPHAIDLGLPSGTKWSCCNLVGDRNFGYFTWGETSEVTYDENSYMTYSYRYKDEDGEYHYYDIGSNISGTNYDAAKVIWGDPWRIPTANQALELINYCTYQPYPGGNMLITGPNGNQIKMSMQGSISPGIPFSMSGYVGRYWTGSLDQKNDGLYAKSLDFSTGNTYFSFHMSLSSDARYSGLTIRPVCQ